MAFHRVSESDLNQNVFREVGKEWMLITAGSTDDFNTMTASWGTFGVLWGRNVAICFVRPTRHTFGYIEGAPYFTLSFFGADHHETLMYCGTHSGRDVDKAAETGLSPIDVRDLDGGIDGTAVAFDEARLVFVCRKLYHDKFDPRLFADETIDQEIYPQRDHHTMYIGEIVSCLRA